MNAKASQPKFLFPEVGGAYKPSGRTTPIAVLLLVLAAPVLGMTAGVLLMGVDWLGSLAGGEAFSGGWSGYSQFLWVIVGLVLLGAGSLAVGVASGWAVGRVGSWGMNRNQGLEYVVVFGVAVVGVWAFYGMRQDELGQEAFDSWVDWVKLVVMAVILVIGAISSAASFGPDERPFCEACRVRMKNVQFDAYPVDREPELVSALSHGTFWELAEGPPLQDLQDGQSRCILTLDYCPRCLALGYVTCTTELADSANAEKGTKKPTRKSRRVAACRADEAHIHELLDV